MTEAEQQAPAQYGGAANDVISELVLEKQSDAAAYFENMKKSFLNINGWYSLCGEKFSNFQVCDSEGNAIEKPEVGCTIKIFTGTKNEDGDGCDWVRIVEFSDHSNEVCFTVRPCSAPVNNCDKTAHFYKSEATNTFGIRLEGNKVIACVLGRNEKINTESDSLANSIRNAVVALGGLIFGSTNQWKALTDSLVKI